MLPGYITAHVHVSMHRTATAIKKNVEKEIPFVAQAHLALFFLNNEIEWKRRYQRFYTYYWLNFPNIFIFQGFNATNLRYSLNS